MNKKNFDFYKYLLFFKKFSPNEKKDFYLNNRLAVNIAIETIMFLEKKTREISPNGRVLSSNSLREDIYYSNFSLEKTADRLYNEFQGLTEIEKRKMKKYDPFKKESFVKGTSVNENLLFYSLMFTDYFSENREKMLNKIMNSFLGPYHRMSYSFFKSLFLNNNETVKNAVFYNLDSFFNSFFSPYVCSISKTKNKIHYISKYIFHLKNQYLNTHFKSITAIKNIRDFFNLSFLDRLYEESTIGFSAKKPSFFFPSLNNMDEKFLEDKESVDNAFIYKFLLERYFSIGKEHLNSILYLSYFPFDFTIQMFPLEKIKKDFKNFITLSVLSETGKNFDKNKITADFIQNTIKNFKKDFLKTEIEERKAYLKTFTNDFTVNAKTEIPYIGNVSFKRYTLEEVEKYMLQKEKNKYLSGYLVFTGQSCYINKDAKMLNSFSQNILSLNLLNGVFPDKIRKQNQPFYSYLQNSEMSVKPSYPEDSFGKR